MIGPQTIFEIARGIEALIPYLFEVAREIITNTPPEPTTLDGLTELKEVGQVKDISAPAAMTPSHIQQDLPKNIWVSA